MPWFLLINLIFASLRHMRLLYFEFLKNCFNRNRVPIVLFCLALIWIYVHPIRTQFWFNRLCFSKKYFIVILFRNRNPVLTVFSVSPDLNIRSNVIGTRFWFKWLYIFLRNIFYYSSQKSELGSDYSILIFLDRNICSGAIGTRFRL